MAEVVPQVIPGELGLRIVRSNATINQDLPKLLGVFPHNEHRTNSKTVGLPLAMSSSFVAPRAFTKWGR